MKEYKRIELLLLRLKPILLENPSLFPPGRMTRLRPRNFHFVLDDRTMVSESTYKTQAELEQRHECGMPHIHTFLTLYYILVSAEHDTACTES
jgi:hypothetical protein